MAPGYFFYWTPTSLRPLKDAAGAVAFITAAGKLQGAGKDLLPALKKLKLSDDKGVREAADEAVRMIEAP